MLSSFLGDGLVLGLITGHSFEKGSKVVAEGEYTPREPELAHQGD